MPGWGGQASVPGGNQRAGGGERKATAPSRRPGACPLCANTPNQDATAFRALNGLMSQEREAVPKKCVHFVVGGLEAYTLAFLEQSLVKRNQGAFSAVRAELSRELLNYSHFLAILHFLRKLFFSLFLCHPFSSEAPQRGKKSRFGTGVFLPFG